MQHCPDMNHPIDIEFSIPSQTHAFSEIHRLPSLPEMHGGGDADVHVYLKCPLTKEIRWKFDEMLPESLKS